GAGAALGQILAWTGSPPGRSASDGDRDGFAGLAEAAAVVAVQPQPDRSPVLRDQRHRPGDRDVVRLTLAQPAAPDLLPVGVLDTDPAAVADAAQREFVAYRSGLLGRPVAIRPRSEERRGGEEG